MKKGRHTWLEGDSKTNTNGYYEKELIKELLGIELSRVLRTRDEEFRSALLPYRKRYTAGIDEVMWAQLVKHYRVIPYD